MRIWIGMADVATVVAAPDARARACPRMPVRVVVASALGVATEIVTRIVAQARS